MTLKLSGPAAQQQAPEAEFYFLPMVDGPLVRKDVEVLTRNCIDEKLLDREALNKRNDKDLLNLIEMGGQG